MVNLMKSALLTFMLSALAFAGTQGPDAGGYSGTDTAVSSFIDISGGGGATSILAGTDDGTVSVTLPFSFSFYGAAYTQVCISSNGAAYFLADPNTCSAVTDFANSDLTAGAPSPDQAAILPLWSDLTFQTAGAGSVFYQTLGTAPNRRFIIQWHNAYPQGSANPVTFQAVLSETSGAVSFQYQTVTLGGGNPADNGAQATIGIRNAGAQTTQQQIQWAFNSPVLSDGFALAFTKGAGPLPPVQTSPTNGGTSIATPVTLTWTASAGATSYDVYFGATNPPSLVTNTTSTSYVPTGVSTSASYNWQVVAKNAAGSAASAIWSFTTAAPPPPPAPSGGGGGGGGGGGSALTATPEAVTLTTSQGGTPSKQTVKLSFQTYTKGEPAFSTNFSTNQGLGWLSVSPATGTMTEASYAGFLYTYTATVTISVDPAGIAAGTSYVGNVNYSAGGGIASTAVTMDVVAQPVEFTVSPKTLSFSYRKGQAKAPDAQTVAVTSKPMGAAFTPLVTTSTGGNWLTVSPASGTAPGNVSISLSAALLANLAPGTYLGKVTLSGNAATALDIPVTLTVIRADAPIVTQGGVVPVYGTTPTIQSGSWISIYGTNLATSTEVWKGDFPTTLGGVTVTVNGKPGYLWFVSPTQINLQAPDDAGTGSVNVVVTTPTGTFTSTVTLAPASPSFSLLDSTHVAAIAPHPDGSYDIVGSAGAFPYATAPVAPGADLILYGVGFGPTDPPVKAGQPVLTPAATVNPVTVTIGGSPAQVVYSGVVGAGLYQINVIVPEGTPSGDQPIRATVGGLQTRPGPVVTIR